MIPKRPEGTEDRLPEIISTIPPAIPMPTLDPVSERLSDAEQALADQQPTVALERINSLPLDTLSESDM